MSITEGTSKLALDTKPTNSLEEINEPILMENPNRFVVFPIVYNDIWKMYKKSMASLVKPLILIISLFSLVIKA